ncbi:MAG: TRAP transporter large permease [Proteobacteria bacterium]|nr:TRAP transporter large permease [Pseudomonadota bacterium]
MGTIALILVVVFVLLLVSNIPIAVAIGISALTAIVAFGTEDPMLMMANKMANGVNSFALLAIPFFIFSGHLMGRGGMARRLIDFASTLVGMLPGGLAYVNTLTCMLFGSISGSAAAAVSSVGGFMIPEMNRKGYNREFNVAVTTTAATTGLLIPPSNVMIVYSVAAGSVSIAAMFMAGVLPGILTGLFIMLVCGYFAFVKKYQGGEKSSLPQILKSFAQAFWSLLLIVIVIGGILGGIFTPTEAAAIAVLYAFILSVVFYREIPFKDMPEILKQTGITTAVVMLLIGASQGMSWIMTMADIPQTVSAALIGLSDNPIVILLTINVLLLFVGTFMDMTPAVLIFTPIFLPVVKQFGMHEVHFGIMLIANLCIGLCTPPVGTCLFIGCGVGKTTIAKVTKTMIPFFLAMIAALMVITYIPKMSLWMPVKTGLIKQEEVDKTMEIWKQNFGGVKKNEEANTE